MKFTVLTLFPEFMDAFFANGIMGRAIDAGVIQCQAVNIRDFSTDKHHNVDDKPYGGGAGMVMQPGPLEAAIQWAKQDCPKAKVVCMSPQGHPFTQAKACELAGVGEDEGDRLSDRGLIFICGRYEGIDERVYAGLVEEELSMGDFVMTGGEVAAMAMIDATARMIPGVLGSEVSCQSESFMDHRLEHAQYTRPEVYNGMAVPEVLLSGNHEKIRQWRKRSSLMRTFMKRPDLFETVKPDDEEKAILKQWCNALETMING